MLYRDDRPVFSTRVIVGQDDESAIRARSSRPRSTRIWFNPPWTIPDDIATNEILPKARQRPELSGAAQHGHAAQWRRCSSWRDPTQALGHLLFEMKNRFDVYLHDTPSKKLFGRDDRRISHGCIRVEDPQRVGRSADAATDRCDRSSDRDRQHHSKRSAEGPCRYSWCTRPRSRMPTAGCSFARMSTDATPRSGRTWIRSGKRRRNAWRPTSAGPDGASGDASCHWTARFQRAS